MATEEKPRRRRRVTAAAEPEEPPKQPRAPRTRPPKKEAAPAQSNFDDFDFESDVRIDPDFLDAEWLRQPGLAFRYAAAESGARDDLKRAKDDFEIIKAKLDSDIRTNPDAFGVIKVTNDTVQAAMTVDDRYQDGQDTVNQAQRRVGLIAAGRAAIDQRKTALENMVRLHGQQYFSGPTAPHDMPEVAEKIEELEKRSATLRVKDALNRK